MAANFWNYVFLISKLRDEGKVTRRNLRCRERKQAVYKFMLNISISISLLLNKFQRLRRLSARV